MKKEDKIKKESKKKIDKMKIVTRIIALSMVIFMVLGIGASVLYYVLKMI